MAHSMLDSSTPAQPRHPTLLPLKGQATFSQLMRTKPQTAWGVCLLHAQLDASDLQPCDLQTKPSIELGLIVPKKAYALAVDRNRVRRVLRAQCQQLGSQMSQHCPQTIQVLFRIKSAKKGEKKPLFPNPHSAEFVASVQKGLAQTLKNLALTSPSA